MTYNFVNEDRYFKGSLDILLKLKEQKDLLSHNTVEITSKYIFYYGLTPNLRGQFPLSRYSAYHTKFVLFL